jgi:hypothetical protein
MTLLLVMNLGFAWGKTAGFNPAWAANANQYIAPTIAAQVPK